jgi:hypothetical protein
MSGSASGGRIVVSQQGCVLVRAFNVQLLRGREALCFCCHVARGRFARLTGGFHFNLKCQRGTL